MNAAEIALIVVAGLILIAVVLVTAARRLDRLHRRENSSRATLEAQLVHRAESAIALAESGLLDPAGAMVVADAGWRAAVESERLVGEDDHSATGPGRAVGQARGLAESELSRALRTALGTPEDQRPLAATPDGATHLRTLAHHVYRVQLARRFHNDAVVQIRHVRSTWAVRLFRLAGLAPMPRPFEMDDEVDVLDPGPDVTP
ncbi:hypothetical protein IM660_10055 [Ruania alkalisoli]|uniref:LemA family protein n=1 Tax=Ruania alkalisoli TaxID=2779775 RepID=A0A7M1SPF4_9MICO|nr:hypothetical protein [Ruania alkalisoli]QOR69087.1 hypothetical protein IM660_10055 [Ruania alkalisoli]